MADSCKAIEIQQRVACNNIYLSLILNVRAKLKIQRITYYSIGISFVVKVLC